MSVNQFKIDIQKLFKIILSCTTKEQLKCAYKMSDLFYKKYEPVFNHKHNYDTGYCVGEITGLFKAKIKELKLQ